MIGKDSPEVPGNVQQPNGLSRIDNAKIWAGVGLFTMMLWTILVGSVLIVPSPWHLLAAFPVTVIVWLCLRESVMETAVVFLLILFLLFISKTPVEHLRSYFNRARPNGSVLEATLESKSEASALK